MAGYTFSGDAVQRIRATVRHVEGQQELPQTSRANSIALQFDYVVFGKTDAAITKGDTGTVSVWDKPQDLGGADTGDNITVVNRFGSIAADKEVLCFTTNFGFLVIAAEC
jgi:hypothetical protein